MAVSDYKQVFAKFRERAKKQSLGVAQDVAQELSKKIVLLTPVDTTRAEANWVGALNTVPIEFDEAKRNLGGSRANLESAKALAKRMKLGDVFVIANSTPYIFFLEQGSSRQAPAGMRNVTAAAFQRMVERSAERRRNGV